MSEREKAKQDCGVRIGARRFRDHVARFSHRPLLMYLKAACEQQLPGESGDLEPTCFAELVVAPKSVATDDQEERDEAR